MKIKIGNHEYEEGDSAQAEFSRFYLEQDSQKSNVYFASARRASTNRDATLYYKVISGKVVYKKSRFKIVASLAAFLMIAVSFAALFSFSGQKIFTTADNSVPIKGGFDEILSAQKALAELRVSRAFFSFNAAYQKFQAVQAPHSYLSSLALSAGEYLPFMAPSSGNKEKSELESEIARSGMAMAKSLEPILKIFQSSILKQEPSDDGGRLSGDSLRAALSEMKNANETLINTQNKLENSGEESFLEIASRLRKASDSFSRLISGVDLAGWTLGVDHPRNFLVVAQNTSRSGATGGAITAAGLITVENGSISKISFDDVYNIDGQLQAKVIPPEPIRKVDTAWGLHSANWFLDFPTSAKKIAYFYQKSQGVFPDGVIAVNDKALEKFLKLTGPIDLLKYDLTIDSGNFNQLTAFNISDEKRANQAKRVFDDALSLIFEKLISLPEDKMADFLGVAKENSANKDMLVWLNEEKYEGAVLGARWGGEVLVGAPDADYLSVVVSGINEASAGFAKSFNIGKQTEITDRGEVINTVTVERKKSGEELVVGKPKETALAYVRLYAPDGSEFVSASGISGVEKTSDPLKKTIPDAVQSEFKTDQDVVFSERVLRVDPASGAQIFQESGKTVFGGWIDGSSGNPAPIIIKYRLPFLVKHQVNLNFIFQKQPGMENRLDFKVLKSGDTANIFSYNGDFSTDLFFSAEIRSSNDAQ